MENSKCHLYLQELREEWTIPCIPCVVAQPEYLETLWGSICALHVHSALLMGRKLLYGGVLFFGEASPSFARGGGVQEKIGPTSKTFSSHATYNIHVQGVPVE